MEERKCSTERGQQVKPKNEFLEQFRREDYVRPMFVRCVSKGVASDSGTLWLELVDGRGNLIVGPHGNKQFSSNWVKGAEKIAT